jgi:peroxiredoxin-like protein
MIESHDYQVRLAGTGRRSGHLQSDEDRLPGLDVASPPEFGGPGSTWTPEHLFVASISACLMTTFQALAEISHLEVLDYVDDATGHLQRGDNGLYRMARVILRPRIVIADESKVDKARQLLMRAEEVCLISRSVSSQVDVDPSVAAHLNPSFVTR